MAKKMRGQHQQRWHVGRAIMMKALQTVDFNALATEPCPFRRLEPCISKRLKPSYLDFSAVQEPRQKSNNLPR